MLGALGVDPGGATDVRRRIRDAEAERWRRPLEPVLVAWNGLLRIDVRLPAGRLDRPLELQVEPAPGENGGPGDHLIIRPTALDAVTGALVGGTSFVAVRTRWPKRLPAGYHTISVRATGARGQATLEAQGLVVSAPRRTFNPAKRGWGVFAPVYGLRSARDWGAGDLTDLDGLMRWTEELGGSFVATLPLLASFLTRPGPVEPSPYSPASRLFWNELYLDVELAVAAGCSADGDRSLRSSALRRRLGRLRETSAVDHVAVMAAKRRVLESAARSFFALESAGDRNRLRAFARRNPELDAYARFRAAGERLGRPWPAWPSRAQGGAIGRGQVDPDAVRYHRFVQWQMQEQLSALSGPGRTGLHLDLPLGVNGAGFDVWRFRALFATGASAGAPPDPFFTGGQNWGFPPLQPQRMREDGYAYLIASLRTLMQHAAVLRVDHVMGTHRMYWVPEGVTAEDGLYIRSPEEEWFAVLSLESHRHRTVLVGEDLGTVPGIIRRRMAAHGVLRSYVLELEASPSERVLRSPKPATLAGLNTHDLPPFAAFWTGLDVEARRRHGWLDERSMQGERAGRVAVRLALVRFLRARGLLPASVSVDDALGVLRACLAYLGGSDAQLVSVALEDLWGETRPQNQPGTTGPENWSGRLRYTMEELRGLVPIRDTLHALDRSRVER